MGAWETHEKHETLVDKLLYGFDFVSNRVSNRQHHKNNGQRVILTHFSALPGNLTYTQSSVGLCTTHSTMKATLKYKIFAVLFQSFFKVTSQSDYRAGWILEVRFLETTPDLRKTRVGEVEVTDRALRSSGDAEDQQRCRERDAAAGTAVKDHREFWLDRECRGLHEPDRGLPADETVYRLPGRTKAQKWLQPDRPCGCIKYRKRLAKNIANATRLSNR